MAPVLIAWTNPNEYPTLAGDIAGYGGSASTFVVGSGNPDRVFVSGAIALDAPQISDIFKDPKGTAEVVAIVEHELGHVVGLKHVTDKTQIMYPEGQPGVDAYGTGDLRGLALLGRGSCHPEV